MSDTADKPSDADDADLPGIPQGEPTPEEEERLKKLLKQIEDAGFGPDPVQTPILPHQPCAGGGQHSWRATGNLPTAKGPMNRYQCTKCPAMAIMPLGQRPPP
jgi:hypothetical protein